MNDAIKAALAEWTDFYLITGTAAAALTGLQFIVQTLLASEAIRPATAGDPQAGIEAFGTPTVVHFTLSLVISAVMCVPWHGYGSLRATLGAIGVGALVYAIVVMRRTHRQRSYDPVAEDWIFHVILPGAAYAGVLACAVFLGDGGEWELFDIAGATLLLLCIGIHNAWDTVTWLTLHAMRANNAGDKPPHPKHNPPGARRKQRK